jgi:hypothetical protein
MHVLWLSVDRLQRIPLSLADFAPTESTTTVTVGPGELVIRSMITGHFGSDGIIGVQNVGAAIPPPLVVRGARVCYVLDNVRTHLRQIRVTHQIGGNPPQYLVDEDDTAQLDEPGTFCTDPTYYTEVLNQTCLEADGALGPFRIFLGLDFGDTADAIHIQSVDLVVAPPF